MPEVGTGRLERESDVAAMQARAAAWRREGKRIAVVPTAGAFHEGHAALLREAGRRGEVVVASILAGPAPGGRDDAREAPRDLERDIRAAEEAGAHCAFTPDGAALLPPGHQTWVTPGPLAERLCGPFRPGYFRGVCTSLAVLFNVVQPEVAVLGEKDWQRLQIVRRMVRDLRFPVEVVGHPTVRDRDGLAFASRNARLSPADRQAAAVIPRALEAARALHASGERRARAVWSTVTRTIATAPARPGGGQSVRLEYCHVCDPETLADVDRLDGPALVAVAVHVGPVRLIDNVILGR